MAYSKEIGICKANILSILENDYELIRLIDETCVNTTTKTVLNIGSLRYKKIFPYYFNPENITETISFIIMKIDTPRIKDKLIKDMVITITCVTNQELMRVPYGMGTRTDLMGACVDRLFNGKDDLGFGYIDLVSSYEGSLDSAHRFRELKFKVEEFNDTRSVL
jgi:hypothetical protein